MSGHYATLLRGTVEGFLPNHDVYITEWVDARVVPLSEGRFDLDDYIDYLISMLHFLGGDAHVIAVCQPSVPVLAAVARMEADGDPHVPHSMVLMGGPIDTRINPTEVNLLAGRRGIDWFRRNVITKVPFPNPGFMRDVYPGFLQLYGFVSMNLDRHMEAHRNLYLNLVKGDGDSAQKHREFYDEYLAVMDLCAEFYLQTCDTVFIRHALPKGEMTHRGIPIDPSKIKRVALMTVEGENDDISGVGQTEAAHALCPNIPKDRKIPLAAVRRRPLRRVQRLALPRRDRAAHRRFRALEQRQQRAQERSAPGPDAANGASHGANGVANGTAKPSPGIGRQDRLKSSGRAGGKARLRPRKRPSYRAFRAIHATRAIGPFRPNRCFNSSNSTRRRAGRIRRRPGRPPAGGFTAVPPQAIVANSHRQPLRLGEGPLFRAEHAARTCPYASTSACGRFLGGSAAMSLRALLYRRPTEPPAIDIVFEQVDLSRAHPPPPAGAALHAAHRRGHRARSC